MSLDENVNGIKDMDRISDDGSNCQLNTKAKQQHDAKAIKKMISKINIDSSNIPKLQDMKEQYSDIPGVARQLDKKIREAIRSENPF